MNNETNMAALGVELSVAAQAQRMQLLAAVYHEAVRTVLVYVGEREAEPVQLDCG